MHLWEISFKGVKMIRKACEHPCPLSPQDCLFQPIFAMAHFTVGMLLAEDPLKQEDSLWDGEDCWRFFSEFVVKWLKLYPSKSEFPFLKSFQKCAFQECADKSLYLKNIYKEVNNYSLEVIGDLPYVNLGNWIKWVPIING